MPKEIMEHIWTISSYVLLAIASGLLGKFSGDIYSFGKRVIFKRNKNKIRIALSDADPRLEGGVYHGPVPDSEAVRYKINITNLSDTTMHIENVGVTPTIPLSPLGYSVSDFKPIDLKAHETYTHEFTINMNCSDIYTQNSYMPAVIEAFTSRLKNMSEKNSFTIKVDYLSQGKNHHEEVEIETHTRRPIVKGYIDRLQTSEGSNPEFQTAVEQAKDVVATLN